MLYYQVKKSSYKTPSTHNHSFVKYVKEQHQGISSAIWVVELLPVFVFLFYLSILSKYF